MKFGFHSKWWATYAQWQSLGGQVKKRPDDVPPGKWGTKIIFFKPIMKVKKTDDGDKNDDFLVLREYTVFNFEQVEGVALDPYRVQPGTAAIDFKLAEAAIAATGADIRYGGDQAAYLKPPFDLIQCPLKEQFIDLPSFYSTLAHELAHWSEHRLGWKGSYALAELRAEIASCFLSSELGIPLDDHMENHTAYLDHWIKEMEADHGVIFRISSAASKAADFILSFSRKEQVVAETVAA